MFAFKSLALNKQEKNPVIYSKKWASLLITALIRVTQTDPEREKQEKTELVSFLIDSFN